MDDVVGRSVIVAVVVNIDVVAAAAVVVEGVNIVLCVNATRQ